MGAVNVLRAELVATRRDLMGLRGARGEREEGLGNGPPADPSTQYRTPPYHRD